METGIPLFLEMHPTAVLSIYGEYDYSNTQSLFDDLKYKGENKKQDEV